MLTKNICSGIPMHHYDMAEIQKDRRAAVMNGIPLTRKQRRKQKRKLERVAKKYGGYVEEY